MTFAYKSINNNIEKVIDNGDSKVAKAVGESISNSSKVFSFDSATKNILMQQPDVFSIKFNLPDEKRNYYSALVLHSKSPNTRAFDQYQFEKYGSLKQIILFRENKNSYKVKSWIYTIHTGSFNNQFGKFFVFIIAIGGAFLVFTGYYTWFKRISKKSSVKFSNQVSTISTIANQV